ncbi:MAG: ATP-binding cassette domain-containing protein, partial [Bacilli bacterium]
NAKYFDNKSISLIDWLRPYSKEQTDTYIRGWLGRMLFSNDEALKEVKVLSGGEKVRCMLAKTMLTDANLLIMDDPTNHLDLESITALNKGMINYLGVLLFSSHDHELLNTVANRIIYIDESKIIDKYCTYDEFLETYGKEIG